ncbi:MAG: radical SAM protein [Ruthenibacterium sp.]
MKEFKSFYKTVSGNEGNKCRYPTRLDTYGCGCAHNCSYCYAKSLLEFRGLWHPEAPHVADLRKIERMVARLPQGAVVRLGGMTDCLQPCEEQYRITYETILLLNRHKIHYLLVTKSDLISSDEYIRAMDPDLAHIQITVTSTSDYLSRSYEAACSPSRRISAIEKLEAAGFDVQLRLSPFIPEYIDFSLLGQIQCHKILVEFLRVNSWIKKWFALDYTKYTHTEHGYSHLPLNEKIRQIERISGFRDISVCEDCSDAYLYWKTHVNANALDCCNLRF